MSPSFFFTYAVALLPLSTLVSAQNVTIDLLKVFPCPFKLDVSVGPNWGSNSSYMDIVLSTKGITPNSLVSYSSGTSNNQRRCYAEAIISHPNLIARARPLGMELSGSVKLDAGMTAKVETGLVWGTSHAMTNFTTATIRGPTNGASTFTHHANVTNRAHPSSCQSAISGSFDDLPSRAKYTEPHITSLFSISGTGNGVGTLGEDAELRYRIYLEWIPGCGSYVQWYDCVHYDRDDNPTWWYQTNETTPGCIDYTRPPPSV